jgi:hypothetical protein
MSDHPIVLAVASYPSRSTAERDLHALAGLRHQARVDQVAAAAVEKGANGWLEIARHHSSATPLAWGVVLLGSALTVVAAPLGIKILASVLATRAAWEGAAVIVSHFWHEVPRDLIRTMANLLEAGQTGVVVVAVGHDAGHITPILSNATAKIVTDCVQGDFESDFATAMAGAKARPLASST